MVATATITAYQNLISTLIELLETNVVTNSLSDQNEPQQLSLKQVDNLPLIADKETAKKILFESINSDTKTIQNIAGLTRVIEYTDKYINEYWEDLPESLKNDLITKASLIDDAIFNEKASKIDTILSVIKYVKKQLIRYLKSLIEIYTNPRKVSDVKQLKTAMQRFKKSIQKLEERDRGIARFREKLAQYPDWDREEQIKRNQGLIKTLTEWLEEDSEQEQARIEHFELFKKIIDENRPSGHKLFEEEWLLF
jgi:hypothetical protein